MHRARTLPLNAVTFMQKLTGDRLPQAEFASFTEFDHAPNGLTPALPVKAVVVWKVG